MPPPQQKCMTSPKATTLDDNHRNVPTQNTFHLPAISSMRLPELQAEVASYELDVRDAKCDQLRVILRALRAEGKSETKADIPGLIKMHKHELQELCRERKIEFDQRTTVPELRQLLKGWKVEDAVSSASASVARPSHQITGDDTMRFGKYPTANYRWVLKNDLGYARWAVLELENSRASPLLARFARWVKAHGVKPLEPGKAKATLETVMAEEVVLDPESVVPTAITQRASTSQGSWAGHRRLRPVEAYEMDISDQDFNKVGDTDQETEKPSPQDAA